MSRRRGPLVALVLALAVVLSVAGCARARVEQPRPEEDGPPPLVQETAGRSAPATIVPAASPEAASKPKTVPAKLVYSGDRKSRKVALTFDLCEVPDKPAGYDAALVKVLEDQQVPATFMMGGHWAETHQKQAKELAAVPFFEIGNHSEAHRHPLKIAPGEFRADVVVGQVEIRRYTGRTPAVFRFPYGEHDKATVSMVASEGLVPVQWDVETGDPDKKVSAAAIVAEVKRKAKGGSIVIMHANGRGVHTAEALPAVIAVLRARGYELVTVSELLGL